MMYITFRVCATLYFNLIRMTLHDKKGNKMPLLDSFTVDHTIMNAPAVRIAKKMQTPGKDTITVFDLRFTMPNKDILSEKGIHTLEHLYSA